MVSSHALNVGLDVHRSEDVETDPAHPDMSAAVDAVLRTGVTYSRDKARVALRIAGGSLESAVVAILRGEACGRGPPDTRSCLAANFRAASRLAARAQTRSDGARAQARSAAACEGHRLDCVRRGDDGLHDPGFCCPIVPNSNRFHFHDSCGQVTAATVARLGVNRRQLHGDFSVGRRTASNFDLADVHRSLERPQLPVNGAGSCSQNPGWTASAPAKHIQPAQLSWLPNHSSSQQAAGATPKASGANCSVGRDNAHVTDVMVGKLHNDPTLASSFHRNAALPGHEHADGCSRCCRSPCTDTNGAGGLDFLDASQPADKYKQSLNSTDHYVRNGVQALGSLLRKEALNRARQHFPTSASASTISHRSDDRCDFISHV